MATTVTWLNAYSTVFVNAPAFNDHNARQVAFFGANEKSCDVWTKCECAASRTLRSFGFKPSDHHCRKANAIRPGHLASRWTRSWNDGAWSHVGALWLFQLQPLNVPSISYWPEATCFGLILALAYALSDTNAGKTAHRLRAAGAEFWSLILIQKGPPSRPGCL